MQSQSALLSRHHKLSSSIHPEQPSPEPAGRLFFLCSTLRQTQGMGLAVSRRNSTSLLRVSMILHLQKILLAAAIAALMSTSAPPALAGQPLTERESLRIGLARPGAISV